MENLDDYIKNNIIVLNYKKSVEYCNNIIFKDCVNKYIEEKNLKLSIIIYCNKNSITPKFNESQYVNYLQLHFNHYITINMNYFINLLALALALAYNSFINNLNDVSILCKLKQLVIYSYFITNKINIYGFHLLKQVEIIQIENYLYCEQKKNINTQMSKLNKYRKYMCKQIMLIYDKNNYIHCLLNNALNYHVIFIDNYDNYNNYYEFY